MSSSTPPINLTFGVPLEDVFPNGAVHPSLKNLFKEIKESVGIHPKTVLKNLKKSDVIPTHHESYLEECVTNCTPVDFMPAESLMWILRQFLGSLPIPLMPRYTDSTYFECRKYSQRCKVMIENSLEDMRNNELLIDKISDELLKLPQINILLVGYLVNLFRALTIKPDRKSIKINTSAALIVIQYFGGCILAGRTQAKPGEIYHPLLLYLIMRWPQIERKCVEKHPNCFMPSGTQNTNTTVSSSRRFNLETIPEKPISIITYARRSVGVSTSTDSTTGTVKTKESSSQTHFISYKDASSQTNYRDMYQRKKSLTIQEIMFERSKLPVPSSCSKCDLLEKEESEKFKMKILSPAPSRRSWFINSDINPDDMQIRDRGEKTKKRCRFGKILSKIGLKKNSGGDPEDKQGDSN